MALLPFLPPISLLREVLKHVVHRLGSSAFSRKSDGDFCELPVRRTVPVVYCTGSVVVQSSQQLTDKREGLKGEWEKSTNSTHLRAN